MTTALEQFMTLRDTGEFQVWHSALLAAMERVPIGEAIAEADTAIRALRQRVPTLKIPDGKLNS